MFKILLQEEIIEYSIRESKRAKRISIRCNSDGKFEIVYPAGLRHFAPEEVIQSKRNWILRTRKTIRNGCQDSVVLRRYVAGTVLPYLGQELHLQLVETPDRRISTYCQDSCLAVVVPRRQQLDEDAVKSAVIGFYRQQAKIYLPLRTSQLASRHGFKYNNIRIKNQKTRWGSCSAKGNLNFNLRLMMAPAGAIDSVIIHELCHLKVLNHSQSFWDLVDQCYPDYRYWKQWFKENGRKLVF